MEETQRGGIAHGKMTTSFQDFQSLAKHLPKLTSLKLYGNYDLDMIDANQWEHLITSSLSH